MQNHCSGNDVQIYKVLNLVFILGYHACNIGKQQTNLEGEFEVFVLKV